MKSSLSVTPRPGPSGTVIQPSTACMRSFVSSCRKRRVFDAVLEQKRVAAGAQPVQAGGHGDGAGVAVVAQPRADLLHALLDVVGVGEAVAREIDLVHVKARASISGRHASRPHSSSPAAIGTGERSRSQR